MAGGTGVIGRRLVPQLIARGHQVTATATSAAGLGLLELGAEGIVMDGLDASPRHLGPVANAWTVLREAACLASLPNDRRHRGDLAPSLGRYLVLLSSGTPRYYLLVVSITE